MRVAFPAGDSIARETLCAAVDHLDNELYHDFVRSLRVDIRDVEFHVGADLCRGWHLLADRDSIAGSARRPLVVMAHGVGGTADTGLPQFAERFGLAGIDVLAFDYRGFGRSGGARRQAVSMQGQIEDYQAAVDFARTLPGVDDRRLALWGVSLSGGHVLSVAARRSDIAAVVALTPLVDGWSAAALALRHRPLPSVARCTMAGMRSRLSTVRGGPFVTMPIVAQPGHDAAINLAGAYESYTSLAGPSWQNRIDAAIGFELLRYRPVRAARDIRCPVLIQIGDGDRSAPPRAAAVAAARSAANVCRYEADHFDVWPGGAHFDDVVEDQRSFLLRIFAARAGEDSSRMPAT